MPKLLYYEAIFETTWSASTKVLVIIDVKDNNFYIQSF